MVLCRSLTNSRVKIWVSNPRFLVVSVHGLSPFSSLMPQSHESDIHDMPSERRHDLGRRILKLRSPKLSAATALDRWAAEGRIVMVSELRQIVEKLKRSQRYKHALEIYSWMDSWDQIKLSANDHASRISLIAKHKSVADAEAYFNQLPNSSSRKAAALPLLNCYVKAKDLDKAETFMYMLQNSALVVDAHPFNEMMKLYVASGQSDRVSSVIQYMRRCMIPLNVLSYNLWMHASCNLYGITSVEKVYEEMIRDNNVQVGWSTYCTLANIYIIFGLHNKARNALAAAKGKLSSTKRLGYYFLMTVYATLQDRDEVLRLWESSKRVPGRITCANYMCIMLSLVKIGNIIEAEKIFQIWEMQCRKYDVRVSNILLGAYTRNGWMDKVEALHFHTLKKGACPNYKTWEILMEGWVKTKQMDRALEAMKKCFSMLRGCHWRPSQAILASVAKYLEEQGNVEEMKQYVDILRRFHLMSLPLYKSCIRVHINRNKVAPDILSMMGRDKIDLDEEIVSLIGCASKCSIKEGDDCS